MNLKFKSITVLRAVNEAVFYFSTVDKKMKFLYNGKKGTDSERAGVLTPSPPTSCAPVIISIWNDTACSLDYFFLFFLHFPFNFCFEFKVEILL